MDKLLLNKYGSKILYNTETNSIKPTPEDLNVNTAFFAKEPGQVITGTEVIDYNKGDLVLQLTNWNGSDYDAKVIICTDVVAKDDIERWFESVNKKVVINEAI